MKDGYQISGCYDFKFEDDKGKHGPHLTLQIPSEQYQCSIALDPMAAMVSSLII